MNKYFPIALVTLVLVGMAYMAYPYSASRSTRIHSSSESGSTLAFSGDLLGMSTREEITKEFAANNANYSYVNFAKVESVGDIPATGKTYLDKIGWIFNADSGKVARYYTETVTSYGYDDVPTPVRVGMLEIDFPKVKLILQEQLPIATVKERLDHDLAQDSNQVKIIRVMADSIVVEDDSSISGGKMIVVKARVMDIQRIPPDYQSR